MVKIVPPDVNDNQLIIIFTWLQWWGLNRNGDNVHTYSQLQVFDSNKDGKLQLSEMAKYKHDDHYIMITMMIMIFTKYVIMTTIMITKFSSSSLPVLTKSSLSPHQVLSKSLTSINMFSPRLLPVKENFLNRPVFKVRLTNSLLDAPRESFLLSRVFTLSKATMGWVGGEIIHYNASLGMGTTISWMQCIQTHTTPATNKQNICIHKD